MEQQNELRKHAYEWIGKLPPRSRFSPSDLYRFLRSNYLEKTIYRGNEEKEPRYQHDARFAIEDAKGVGLVFRAKRGLWERTDAPLPPIGITALEIEI
jgi:hypothetical protein